MKEADKLDIRTVQEIVPAALKEMGLGDYWTLSQLVEFRTQDVGSSFYRQWVVRGKFNTRQWFSIGVRKQRACTPSTTLPFPERLHEKLINFAADQAKIALREEEEREEAQKLQDERAQRRKSAMERLGISQNKLDVGNTTFYRNQAKLTFTFEYTDADMDKLADIREILGREGYTVY
jgi:hypothetical protein